MALEKAQIINSEDPNSKPIVVMFNPPELKVSSSNNYADTKAPGNSKEKKQFIGKNNDELTVVLFFDATRMDKSLRESVDPYGVGIYAYVDPILQLGRIQKNKKTPPKLVFAWGSEYFPCVILSIDQKYDYFDSAGIAQRAELTIKFQRHEPEEEAPAAKAKPSITKTIVKAGEDLTCFCYDPKDWRIVAEANNIDNPLVCENGGLTGLAISTAANSLL